MQKYLIIFVIALFSMFAVEARAEDNGNGVDVITNDYEELHLSSATWYSDFDPTTEANYIYNEDKEATVTSGLFDTLFILDGATLTVDLTTLNSTSITVRVEGKNEFGNWAELFSQTYTSAMTIAEPFPIVTYVNGFRVGLIVVGNVAGDNISITGDFITKERIAH